MMKRTLVFIIISCLAYLQLTAQTINVNRATAEQIPYEDRKDYIEQATMFLNTYYNQLLLNVDELMVQKEFIKSNMSCGDKRYKPEFNLQNSNTNDFLTPEQYLQELEKQYRVFQTDRLDIIIDNVSINQEDFYLPNLVSCYVIADYNLTFIYENKTLFKRRCRAYCLFPKVSVSIIVKLMQIEPMEDIIAYEMDNKLIKKENKRTDNRNVTKPNITTSHNAIRIIGKEAVDLGLSVKWAAYDLGATHSREHGKKYSWGENIFKEVFTAKNSLTYNKKEYNITIKNISGNKNHDAASFDWGQSWRIPTQEEFRELIVKCKWVRHEWGYQVIGPNGNFIEFYFLDEFKRYWAADLDMTCTKKEAYYLSMIKNESLDDIRLFKAVRWAGFYIRPVSD